MNLGYILLVEDNMNDAELTIRALKKCGLKHPIIHLQDGEMALNHLINENKPLEVQSNRPLVIILDINMPKINGLEVLKILKSNVIAKLIPIVIFTSSMENRDLAEAYDLGVNSYVVKPVNYDKFTQAITQLANYWIKLNRPPIV